MPRDWNDIDQSGSQSDKQHDNEQTKISQKHKQQQKTKQNQSQLNTTQQPIKQPLKQRPKFLSDQQLIQKIRSKQLQQRKKIKIVKCFSQQLIQMLKNNKLISYCKQIKLNEKPAFYILSFKIQEDLISFIQQKITNKYKFYLQPYIKTQKDIEREKQREERKNQYNNKRNYQDNNYSKKQDRYKDKQYKEDRFKDKQDKQDRYKDKEDNMYKDKEDNRYKQNKQRQYDNKRTNRNRPQYDQPQDKTYSKKQFYKPQQKNKYPENKQSKTQQQKSQFNFQFKDNIITIKQNAYSKTRIVDQIVKRKIASKFNKIKILVRPDGFDKAIQLIQLIYDQVQYGLRVLPDQHLFPSQQFIQITLQPNCHLSHPNSEYRLLSSNSKRHFQQLRTKNKYRISKDFNIDEYVKGFKQNQKELCKKWNQISIKAEGDNIPNLMKLSHKLKKELYISIQIKVGERNQIPWTILVINPQTDKQKRPKVDASFVNSYLTN